MVINRELNLFKIKNLSDQIFDYLNLTFYDIESQLDSKFTATKVKFNTFADKHFNNSIEDLLKESEIMKINFPEVSDKINETVCELKNQFEDIINNQSFDLSYIEKLKNNLNKYLDKFIV